MKVDKIFEEIGKRYFELELKRRTASEEHEMAVLKELRIIVLKNQ